MRKSAFSQEETIGIEAQRADFFLLVEPKLKLFLCLLETAANCHRHRVAGFMLMMRRVDETRLLLHSSFNK